jgi:hypothetical protein
MQRHCHNGQFMSGFRRAPTFANNRNATDVPAVRVCMNQRRKCLRVSMLSIVALEDLIFRKPRHACSSGRDRQGR